MLFPPYYLLKYYYIITHFRDLYCNHKEYFIIQYVPQAATCVTAALPKQRHFTPLQSYWLQLRCLIIEVL